MPSRRSRRSPSPRGYSSKWSRSRSKSRSPPRVGARTMAGYRRSPIPRSPTPPSRSPYRSRATRASPTHTRSRSPMRSRSPIHSRSRSPARHYRTSPARKRSSYSPPRRRSPMRSRSRSSWRSRDRSPMRSRSPLARSRSPLRRSSRGRSPPRRGRSPPLPTRGRSPPLPMRGRSPPPPRGRSPPRRGSLVDRMRSAPLNGGPPPLLERERAAGAATMRAPLFMQDVPGTVREPAPRLRLRDFRPDPDRLPPPPLPRQPLSAGRPPGRRDRILPPPMPSRSLPMPNFFLQSRLAPSVLRVAEELFTSGMFKPHDIMATNIPHLELLPPEAAIAALDEYASLDKMRLNSPPAFFTGIIKRIFRGLPPPSGRPDRTVPPTSLVSSMPLKRPLSPPRRSPPPPRSRSLPRGADPVRPPPPLMEASSQRAPTSWAPISSRPRDRPRSRGRDDYPPPLDPPARIARSSLSPRRRGGDPGSPTAGGTLPPPPPLPLPPPPAAALSSDDPIIGRQPPYMDASMPLPASASPDHIRGGGMSRRRYNDSPPPLRSAGGYLDRHAPHPSRRAPVPMDEYDRMPLSTRGLPPPRGSSRYDPPLRHTGFSGPPPPLMDMRGRGLSRSPTPPPYGAPMPRRAASPPFRAPYGPGSIGRAPYLAPPPISTYGEPYARRHAYDDVPPPRSSRAPLRSVATIVQPSGGRGDPDRRASSLERQQDRSLEGNGRRNSDREYEREREHERDGGRREQDSERWRSQREHEHSSGRDGGRQERRSPSPSGAAPTGADLAAAGSDDMREDKARERQDSPEASARADAQAQQQEGAGGGKDEEMAEAGGEGRQGGGDDSQQPTFLDELLAAGDGMEGWENENAEMEEAGGGGDAFDMSNLVDRKQVQKART
uniref:Heterogeneous nuclear ribonucleoprotein Q acidic domain-containing protein n=1 Tax=Dunaliella tertiolecta TaxID=3047 RepID=A0A7S3R7Q8_DUNTE